jgi:exopolysaccharide production protein ExoQ
MTAVTAIPANSVQPATGIRPGAWLAMLVFCAAFYAAGQEFHASQREAFTADPDTMEAWTEGGNALRQVAFLSLGVLGLAMLVLPARQSFAGAGLPGTLLVLFVAWCGASVAWSIDGSITARRFVVLGCVVVAALGVARQFTLRELCFLAVAAGAAYLAVGVAAELSLGSFRPHRLDYRFAGTMHPNTQGGVLAALSLASVALIRSWPRWRSLFIATLCAGLVFLVLTKSRTSCVATLLGLAGMWFVAASPRFKATAGLGLAGVAAVAMLAVVFSGVDVEDELTSVTLLGRQEESESLTGRVPLWIELATYASERPLLGFGYEAFWNAEHIDAVSDEMQWGIREAHNAYLDTVLGVGFVGAGLFVLAGIAGLAAASRRYAQSRDPAYAFVFGLVAFGLANGLLDSGLTMPLFVTFVTYCGLARVAFFREGEAGGEPRGAASTRRREVD